MHDSRHDGPESTFKQTQQKWCGYIQGTCYFLLLDDEIDRSHVEDDGAGRSRLDALGRVRRKTSGFTL